MITTFERIAGTVWRRSFDVVLVARPGSSRVSELRGPAIAMWDALAEPVSVTELVAVLEEQFAVGDADVRAEVLVVLGELCDRGLVERRES